MIADQAPARRIRRFILRVAVSTVHQLRRAWWFVRRPHSHGVHALVMTDGGGLLLVKHTYRSGWYFPGGGRKSSETDEAAILRELREEVGLTAWRDLTLLERFDRRFDWKHDHVALFLVRGAHCAPRPSLEIEDAVAFDLDRLPADIPQSLRAKIDRYRDRLGTAA